MSNGEDISTPIDNGIKYGNPGWYIFTNRFTSQTCDISLKITDIYLNSYNINHNYLIPGPFVIDDFVNSDQSISMNNLDINNSVSNQMSGPTDNIIGGVRKIKLHSPIQSSDNNTTCFVSGYYYKFGYLHIDNSALNNPPTGGINLQGVWNARDNIPNIPQASNENNGFYYKVSVSGNTEIDGNSNWNVCDWIVSDGSIWNFVPNQETTSSTLTLMWDGGSGTSDIINISGLGSINILNSDIGDRSYFSFFLDVNTNSNGVTLDLTVWSNGGLNSCTNSIYLDGFNMSEFFPHIYTMNFLDFINIDFTDISAIQLDITGPLGYYLEFNTLLAF